VWHGLQNIGDRDALTVRFSTLVYEYADRDRCVSRTTRLRFPTRGVPGTEGRFRADATRS